LIFSANDGLALIDDAAESAAVLYHACSKQSSADLVVVAWANCVAAGGRRSRKRVRIAAVALDSDSNSSVGVCRALLVAHCHAQLQIHGLVGTDVREGSFGAFSGEASHVLDGGTRGCVGSSAQERQYDAGND
jgi:hypothetical protein